MNSRVRVRVRVRPKLGLSLPTLFNQTATRPPSGGDEKENFWYFPPKTISDIRDATNCYFHCQLTCWMSAWSVKSEIVEKCECFSKLELISSPLVLSTSQIYSVYSHGGEKKPKIFIYKKLYISWKVTLLLGPVDILSNLAINLIPSTWLNFLIVAAVKKKPKKKKHWHYS